MKKILIIEDNQKTALALAVRLKAEGYATWIAGDSIRGMQLARRQQPDLILLDIGLPGGNGFDLAETLKLCPETRDISIVFLTASRDRRFIDRVIRLGAAGFLEKPYDAAELLVLIQFALDRPRRSPGPLPGSQASPAISQSKEILIVEDDINIAHALAVRLKALGYKTRVAHDGLSGVRFAAINNPDLLLLDISLPAGSGFTVAECIQANVPHPIPMIFLTASRCPQFRERARALGAVDFFEKPFEAEALVAAVRKAVTRPHAELSAN
jgi:DNA-binding response OmpR family regulator